MKKIYLLGIGGIAMANLAGLLKSRGYLISGSDSGIFGPAEKILKNLKIKYFNDYERVHIQNFEPDLVVIGNSISRGNDELEYILDKGMCYKSMPEVIEEEFIRGKKAIVIAGSGGKTTTTALIAWILQYNKLQPSALIGGTVKNFNSGFLFNKGEYIVLEGDEYNSAFFDICPKFLHYRPHIGVINNIALDHVDIYPTLEAIQKTFIRFIRLIPRSGLLILNKNNRESFDLKKHAQTNIGSFGKNADLDAKKIKFKDTGTTFDVNLKKVNLGKIETRLLGRHNVENILAAISVALKVGITFKKVTEAINKFEGVKRRLEIIYKDSRVTIIDDFAHNPQKVTASLNAIRQHFPKNKIIAIFEPRTASSRRKVFQSSYPESFSEANLVYIAEPFKKEALSPNEVFSHKQLAKDLNSKNIKAYAINSADKITKHLKSTLKFNEKITIVIMSSGEFDSIHGKIVNQLKAL